MMHSGEVVDEEQENEPSRPDLTEAFTPDTQRNQTMK